MKLQTRIRRVAAKKTVVKITARKKSKTGFIVFSANGSCEPFKTKKAAMQNLLAKIRCAESQIWELLPAPF